MLRETENEELIALMPAKDVHLVLNHVGIQDLEIKELLRRAELSLTILNDPEAMIGPTQIWRLFSALGYVLEDEMCGMLPNKIAAGSLELIIARAMHCETLGDALIAFASAARLLMPNINMEVVRRLDKLHFNITFSEVPSRGQHILLELTCLPYHSLFQWLSGTSFPMLAVKTARSQLSNSIHHLSVLNCELVFEGEGVEMIYPREIEELRLKPGTLLDWRNGIFQVFLNDLRKRNDSFSISRLGAYVENALRNGINNQQLIADSAAMSLTTFRRKLSLQNISFRDLRDKVFRESCHQYLGSELTVEEMAERLGYSDSSSFRRTFRRVFGYSPSQYRER